MKAWTVFCKNPCDGVLLVFAETRNKARSIAVSCGLWEWDYLETSCRRVGRFDQYYTGKSVIVDNSDLPSDAPIYYWEGVEL